MEIRFCELLQRLLDRLNLQVRNGKLTERALARRVGLSQSHMHNVLNGARILTAQTADLILAGTGIGLLDLLEYVEAEQAMLGKESLGAVDEVELSRRPKHPAPVVRIPPGRVTLRDTAGAPRKRSVPS